MRSQRGRPRALGLCRRAKHLEGGEKIQVGFWSPVRVGMLWQVPSGPVAGPNRIARERHPDETSRDTPIVDMLLSVYRPHGRRNRALREAMARILSPSISSTICLNSSEDYRKHRCVWEVLAHAPRCLALGSPRFFRWGSLRGLHSPGGGVVRAPS